MKHKLLSITKKSNIPEKYFNTPIGLLLEYQNLKRQFGKYSNAQLLIGMCMDHRKHLLIPENFAYIIRTGGANLKFSAFKVSYAIAIGGVQHIALIGHNNCGMVNLKSKENEFINGLVDKAGWTYKKAKKHFSSLACKHEIINEIDFIVKESKRIKKEYPKVNVAPLFYNIENNKLYCIET